MDIRLCHYILQVGFAKEIPGIPVSFGPNIGFDGEKAATVRSKILKYVETIIVITYIR